MRQKILNLYYKNFFRKIYYLKYLFLKQIHAHLKKFCIFCAYFKLSLCKYAHTYFAAFRAYFGPT